MRILKSAEICSTSGSGNLAASGLGFLGGIAGTVYVAMICAIDPTIPDRFNAYVKSFQPEKNELDSMQTTLPVEK